MKRIEKRQEKIMSAYDILIAQRKELEEKLIRIEKKFDKRFKFIFDTLQKISDKK